jgi:hypothetical protein
MVGVVAVSFYMQESSSLHCRCRTGCRFPVSWDDNDDDDAATTVIGLLMPASYVSLRYKNDLSSFLVLLDMQMVVVCISNHN